MFKRMTVLSAAATLIASGDIKVSEGSKSTEAANPTTTETSKPAAKTADPELEKAKSEKDRLAILNAYATEREKQKNMALRAEIARLKLEKELLNEKIALAAAKQNSTKADEIAKYEAEKAKLSRETTLAKLRSDYLANQLKEQANESSLKINALSTKINEFETANKAKFYANADPVYLDNPLKEDGTLVISDRRIPFNGAVTGALADRVTERINFYNNKDPKKPIFIVIDDSPGGSVMAGYRILKAMEGSEAPVYVVVKSFAASMAACVTTLAERSFVYPNAIILHHQIMQSFMFRTMNLTEQEENFEDLQKWWKRLGGPIAKKMGISTDEFIKQMYENTVSGDWTEFGDDAVKLKWADHVVSRVHETSLLKSPDAKKPAPKSVRIGEINENGLTYAIDSAGKPYMILPRRNPKDAYLMYNPDGYYRFK